MARLVDPVVQPGTMSSMAQPELVVDDNLVLRPWEDTDVPVVVTAYADPDIQKWAIRSVDEAEAHEWIKAWAAMWAAETDASWAVVSRSDRSVVLGRVALRRISLKEGMGEMTYWTLPQARRKGFASRSVMGLSAWAFKGLGLHRLDLLHSVQNKASCHVATAAGYELEGTLREYLLHADGWHDMHLHSQLTRSDRSGPMRSRPESR
jgi:ribosomal-protein-alanine N-acetyltransferase